MADGMTVDELADLIAASSYFEPGAMVWVRMPPKQPPETVQAVAQVLRQIRERTQVEFFLTAPTYQIEQLGHVALDTEVAEVLTEHPQVQLAELVAALQARFLIVPRNWAVTLRAGPSPPS